MPSKRAPAELRPEQKEFARLYTYEGMSQVDAYCLAYGHNPEMKGEAREKISERARRLKGRPRMQEYMRKLRRDLKLKDVDNPINAMRDLLSDMELARRKGNHSALASMHRLRFSFHGLQKQEQPQQPEQRLTDDELIEAIAEGDPAKAKLIKKILGSQGEPVESDKPRTLHS